MHTEFMKDMHDAILTVIDKVSAPYHNHDTEDVLPAMLAVLSRISASVAIGFNLNEKQFALGMINTFREVQKYEAALAALDAIEKAAGAGPQQ